jgi:hypothetical protein
MQEAALSPDCITELRENKDKVQDLAPINTGLLAKRTPVSRSTEGTEPKFTDLPTTLLRSKLHQSDNNITASSRTNPNAVTLLIPNMDSPSNLDMVLLDSISPSNPETSNGTSQIRACASCSRAKAKCVPDQEGNGKCQR